MATDAIESQEEEANEPGQHRRDEPYGQSIYYCHLTMLTAGN